MYLDSRKSWKFRFLDIWTLLLLHVFLIDSPGSASPLERNKTQRSPRSYHIPKSTNYAYHEQNGAVLYGKEVESNGHYFASTPKEIAFHPRLDSFESLKESTLLGKTSKDPWQKSYVSGTHLIHDAPTAFTKHEFHFQEPPTKEPSPSLIQNYPLFKYNESFAYSYNPETNTYYFYYIPPPNKQQQLRNSFHNYPNYKRVNNDQNQYFSAFPKDNTYPRTTTAAAFKTEESFLRNNPQYNNGFQYQTKLHRTTPAYSTSSTTRRFIGPELPKDFKFRPVTKSTTLKPKVTQSKIKEKEEEERSGGRPAGQLSLIDLLATSTSFPLSITTTPELYAETSTPDRAIQDSTTSELSTIGTELTSTQLPLELLSETSTTPLDYFTTLSLPTETTPETNDDTTTPIFDEKIEEISKSSVQESKKNKKITALPKTLEEEFESEILDKKSVSSESNGPEISTTKSVLGVEETTVKYFSTVTAERVADTVTQTSRPIISTTLAGEQIASVTTIETIPDTTTNVSRESDDKQATTTQKPTTSLTPEPTTKEGLSSDSTTTLSQESFGTTTSLPLTTEKIKEKSKKKSKSLGRVNKKASSTTTFSPLTTTTVEPETTTSQTTGSSVTETTSVLPSENKESTTLTTESPESSTVRETQKPIEPTPLPLTSPSTNKKSPKKHSTNDKSNNSNKKKKEQNKKSKKTSKKGKPSKKSSGNKKKSSDKKKKKLEKGTTPEPSKDQTTTMPSDVREHFIMNFFSNETKS